jgi:hypothetical protein
VNQVIKISNLVPNVQYYIDEGTLCPFTLFNLKNPTAAGLAGGFEIKVFDQDYLIMKTEVMSDFGVAILPEALSSLKVYPDNYRTRASTPYTFSFIITNPVRSTSSIRI